MLSVSELEKLETKALQQRKMNDLGDTTPIGEKIFSIIESVYSAYVLLYPLKTKRVAGFTRKQGDLLQVFVNTSFNNSFQNFAAAHELYHLIDFKEKDEDKFIVCDNKDIDENMDETSTMVDELKANYFAAAFLMPRSVIMERFSKKITSHFVAEDIILEILKIQYEYEIPFKTILKRLIETKRVSQSQYEKLVSYDTRVVEFCRMLDDTMCTKVKNLECQNLRKYHTLNVPKLAFDAYRSSIISVAKLEAIIGNYDKTLDDFQVVRPVITPIPFDLSDFGSGEVEGCADED